MWSFNLPAAGLVVAQSPGAPGGQSGWGVVVMMVAMVAIFYFMLIRPQQKQAKAHREMLSQLKRGDGVIVGGGMLGRIHQVSEKFIVVEIGRDLRVRVLKGFISGRAPEGLLEEPEL